jgi:DNA-binding winged helix-turn-helix (wHTH) protein
MPRGSQRTTDSTHLLQAEAWLWDIYVHDTSGIAGHPCLWRRGGGGPVEAMRSVAGLISGEDPRTDRASDARRWIDIYSRLIEFKEELLGRLAEGRGDEPTVLDEKVQADEMEHLRRRLAFWQSRHAQLAPLDLDRRLGIAARDGDFVQLTRREAELLRFLLEQPGRHFQARALAARAWGEPHLAAEQVRTYVVRLRRRLAEAKVPCQIQTRRGLGYALVFTHGAVEKAS